MIDLAMAAMAPQGAGRGEMVFFVVGVVMTIICLIVFIFLIRLANQDEKQGQDSAKAQRHIGTKARNTANSQSPESG